MRSFAYFSCLRNEICRICKYKRKYANMCRKFRLKICKICKRKMQYMLKNSKYAIQLATFLAVPVQFQQALHWSSQQRIRVNTLLLINTLGFTLFGREQGRPPCRPAASRLLPFPPPPLQGQHWPLWPASGWRACHNRSS